MTLMKAWLISLVVNRFDLLNLIKQGDKEGYRLARQCNDITPFAVSGPIRPQTQLFRYIYHHNSSCNTSPAVLYSQSKIKCTLLAKMVRTHTKW